MQTLEMNHTGKAPVFLPPDEMKGQFEKLFPDPKDVKIAKELIEIIIEHP